MEEPLDLIAETISHFSEGARSVKAYTDTDTYIITKADANDYWLTREEPGFPKTRITSLDPHFRDVFGIEAKY